MGIMFVVILTSVLVLSALTVLIKRSISAAQVHLRLMTWKYLRLSFRITFNLEFALIKYENRIVWMESVHEFSLVFFF